MEFAELCAKTHYSFLRGASTPAELIERASELGLRALGITDRHGVYGIPRAYEAAKKFSALKLIVGSELSLESLPYIGLLSINRKGYGLMCRLLSASHEGREKGEAALSWVRFRELLQNPKYQEGREGLIALPHWYEKSEGVFDYPELSRIFGDRLYLPLFRAIDGKDQERTDEALGLSRRYGIPLLATADPHFHVRERRNLQDALVAIRENTPLDQVGARLFSNAERYLKSPAQMQKLFADMPEAIEATLAITERCTFSCSELRYYYPSEWIPEGETPQGYLERLTWEGARGRYAEGIPEDVRKQIEYEFSLVRELKFADYFLTIWEIVEFARGRKILCQGRGSAANSVICYCLGITAVDPVRMSLLFERFISAERGEPPDIDVDFEHERREEVIQHIYEKYGRDRAGMVAAVITYRTRSALRDLTKVLGMDREHPSVVRLKDEIRGFPRHLSIHSGGFTLSADPIIETVPIEPARMEGRTIVQWDKEDLAIIGLLKVDVLALGMLSALRKTLDLVTARGTPLTLATIPAEDPATYSMIQKGDTVGVFQIESRAQMSMLKRLLPKTFYDLVIEVAIVRPGPIVGQMVHPYLKRRRGLESPRSPDPRLEPILERTLGVPLFQEQVMKIAIVMADFTPGEADELRRAIGAWRSSGSVEKVGRRLMDGLLKNGLPEEFVQRLFLQIQGFAEYGFPESHAASFALLAYASSYLKCHYPAEFLCALVNSQPMGFYANHTLIDDAKRHGIKVLAIDPHISEWDCQLEGGAVRLGFRVVSGISHTAVRHLIDERGRRPFQSLSDFISRSKFSLRVLNTLAMGDAFSAFGMNQRDALWTLLATHAVVRPERVVGQQQLALFSEADLTLDTEPWAGLKPLTEDQAIYSDYQSFGLSVRGHPMTVFRRSGSKKIPKITTSLLKKSRNGQTARIAGLVIARQRPPTAKGTAFATLEDEEGFMDLIIHKDVYEKYEKIFTSGPFLLVSGKIQRDTNLVSLIVKGMESLDSEFDIGSRDFK